MKKLVGIALVATAVLLPGTAEARGYRNGSVTTPFGSVNTNSPAYRMAGGDPFLAAQIQQNMQLMKLQQQMVQQQQKMQQQFQQRMKSDPNFRKQVEAQQAQLKAAYEAELQKYTKKKKKRPTFHGTASAKSELKTRNDDKPASEEKPAASSSNSDLKSRRDEKTEGKAGK